MIVDRWIITRIERNTHSFRKKYFVLYFYIIIYYRCTYMTARRIFWYISIFNFFFFLFIFFQTEEIFIRRPCSRERWNGKKLLLHSKTTDRPSFQELCSFLLRECGLVCYDFWLHDDLVNFFLCHLSSSIFYIYTR